MPRSQLPHGGGGGCALVTAIGKDAHDKGKQAADFLEHRQSAITILNIGRLDMGRQNQAKRIDDDVPLFAFDFLARVIARRVNLGPPFSAPLTL